MGQPEGERWPGPPSTWPGGPGGAIPGGPSSPHGGPGPDGPPPPPWRRRQRRWLLIVAGVLAAVLLVVAAVLAARGLASLARDIDLTSPTSSAPSTPEGSGPRTEVEVVEPDLTDLDGTDAELGEVLVDVNRSEEQMLATQEEFGEILAAGPGSDLEDLVDELSAAAGDGQRALQDIRRDLTSTSVSDGDVREVRDRYLAHLDAWVRYFVAIEADPALLAGAGGDEAFLLAIDTTGDAFARSIRDDLPDDLDDSVRAFADQIVDRGFPERSPSADDTV